MYDLETSVLPLDRIDTALRRSRGAPDQRTVDRLAESIRRCGVLNPVLVMKRPANDDTYHLLSGLHRLEGAKQAQLTEIPARTLAESDTLTADLLLDAFDEDVVRKTIQPLEMAALIQAMKHKDMHINEIEDHLHMTNGHINSLLRLLTLPEEVKEMLRAGDLQLAKARTLAGLNELKLPKSERDAHILKLAKETIALGETCAVFSRRVQQFKAEVRGDPALHRKEQDIDALHRVVNQRDRLLAIVEPVIEGTQNLKEVAEILRPLHARIETILDQAAQGPEELPSEEGNGQKE